VTGPHRRKRTAPNALILLGRAEAAYFLRVRPDTIRQWKHRGLMPPADVEIGGTELWVESSLRAWAEQTGRAHR
jgi:hypothetical protein